jgi:hypothetical protein
MPAVQQIMDNVSTIQQRRCKNVCNVKVKITAYEIYNVFKQQEGYQGIENMVNTNYARYRLNFHRD